MDSQIVLSHVQTHPLLAAHAAGRPTTQVSPDLGLTHVAVTLTATHVEFTADVRLTWEQIEVITAAPSVCFALSANQLHKLQHFSETTNRFCSLLPTAAAPALLVAGFPMHRIKGTTPDRDAASKIPALAPVTGHVLDTATGLGYTAIQAARTAAAVTTIELDPTVLALARHNPWSRSLFDHPRITQHLGDSFDVVQTLGDGAFDQIVHDPPTLSLAGDLYSGDFYVELYRVLRRGGRLFHYLGDPDSPLGHRTGKGAQQRLLAAGFSRLRPARAAFGVVVYK